MGGTLTLNPDGFISSKTFGWVVVGGGTLSSAVADSNDSTYITDTTPGAANTRITWTFGTSSLPAGAAVKYSYPVIRNSQPTGNRQLHVSLGTYNPPDNISYQSPAKVWTPVAGIVDTSGTAAGAVPQGRSQGVVDLLVVSVLQYPAAAFAEDHRIYKVQAKVVYVDSPTVATIELSPTSANTLTTRPGVAWGINSPDGLAQYEYRVALWKLSDVTAYPGGRSAFEAAVSTVFSATGYGSARPKWISGNASSAWVVSADTTVTPDADLDGSSQYVYYVQVSALHSGERLSHPTSMGILDFTQSITIPTVPTSVTPTWVGTPSYRGSVVVAYPAQTLGAWSGRKLIVQGRSSGSTDEADWKTLPLGTTEIGSGSGSLTFYDTVAYHTQSRHYRAKTLLWVSTDDFTSGSAWVTSSAIVASYDVFVLRNPFASSGEVIFKILGDFTATQDEILGEFRPLGTSKPVVVSDVVLAKRWSVEVLVKDKSTEVALDALREAQSPLLLHTDMDFIMYWVRIGPNIQKRVLRQNNRKTDSLRSQIWQMDLISVAAPVDQPNGSF